MRQFFFFLIIFFKTQSTPQGPPNGQIPPNMQKGGPKWWDPRDPEVHLGDPSAARLSREAPTPQNTQPAPPEGRPPSRRDNNSCPEIYEPGLKTKTPQTNCDWNARLWSCGYTSLTRSPIRVNPKGHTRFSRHEWKIPDGDTTPQETSLHKIPSMAHKQGGRKGFSIN